jgi:hypothetical protein
MVARCWECERVPPQVSTGNEMRATVKAPPAAPHLPRPTSPERITRDDDAHDPYDCDHPYRTARSPVNTPVHQDARNSSGAKPPAARGCPLACSVSQEEA